MESFVCGCFRFFFSLPPASCRRTSLPEGVDPEGVDPEDVDPEDVDPEDVDLQDVDRTQAPG